MIQSPSTTINETISERQALALVGLPLQNRNREKLRTSVPHTIDPESPFRSRRYTPADCIAYKQALDNYTSPHPIFVSPETETFSESKACQFVGLAVNPKNRQKLQESIPFTYGPWEGINVRRYLVKDCIAYRNTYQSVSNSATRSAHTRPTR